jgi:hypothetical protein
MTLSPSGSAAIQLIAIRANFAYPKAPLILMTFQPPFRGNPSPDALPSMMHAPLPLEMTLYTYCARARASIGTSLVANRHVP